MTIPKFPDCPECGTLMRSAGSALSGRKSVPQWRCPKCKRRTIVNKEAQSGRV